jgi:hypothetical protein
MLWISLPNRFWAALHTCFGFQRRRAVSHRYCLAFMRKAIHPQLAELGIQAITRFCVPLNSNAPTEQSAA